MISFDLSLSEAVRAALANESLAIKTSLESVNAAKASAAEIESQADGRQSELNRLLRAEVSSANIKQISTVRHELAALRDAQPRAADAAQRAEFEAWRVFDGVVSRVAALLRPALDRQLECLTDLFAPHFFTRAQAADVARSTVTYRKIENFASVSWSKSPIRSMALLETLSETLAALAAGNGL